MDSTGRTSTPSPWMPFESRRRARDEKREAVLRTAAQLFLEVGYRRATLNEIAERLNITKPALYNYFRNKEEILHECYRLGQAEMDARIAEIDACPGTGLDKLRMMIREYALLMTVDFGMCLVRLDDRELAPAARAEVRRGWRRCDARFRAYIAEGIADGSVVDCDPKLSAFAIAGSLNWIGHWFSDAGPLSAEAVAEEFARRLTEGLARR